MQTTLTGFLNESSSGSPPRHVRRPTVAYRFRILAGRIGDLDVHVSSRRSASAAVFMLDSSGYEVDGQWFPAASQAAPAFGYAGGIAQTLIRIAYST